MANFVANSGFDEDMEARANEAGVNSQSQTQQTQTANNNNLYSNPYLNPSGESISRGPEPIIIRDVPQYESVNKNYNSSSGSLELNLKTISPEYKIEMLRKELEQATVKVTEDSPEILIQKKESEPAKNEKKVQKQAENIAIKSILIINKISQGIFGFLKDVFGAFKGIYELVSFRSYTPEQKKRIEEDKKKAQAKAAIQKSYFSKISENARDLYYQTNKNLVELEDRLGITGLTIELRNRYLGRRRNMSDEEKNIHLSHFTALGVREEQMEKELEQRKIQIAQTQAKSPLDLNKVAEGGSLLSSTGGQGAG